MSPGQQTLRMTGLPAAADKDDIRSFFDGHIRRQGFSVVEEIGHICKQPGTTTNQTTVTFSSREAATQALNLDYGKRRLTAAKGGVGMVSLDQHFSGMTTLQSTANPETGKPDIDIVALHGLTGHAWNTFTASEVLNSNAGRTRENNWLQENLPRLLLQHEEKPIHARIMTFGYNADVWMSNSEADLDEPVRNLLWALRVERQDAVDRPLFFIAHSLGGIVTKEAIVSMANEAVSDSVDPQSKSQGKYVFPVKGCLFFGVPHKGAKIANLASGILTGLNKVFNVNKHNVHDLTPKSERLARISREFEETHAYLKFPVMSFYETRTLNYAVGQVVSRESATFEYHEKPQPFGIDKDHKEMVKFLNDNEPAVNAAILFLTDLAKKAIGIQELRKRIPSTLQPRRNTSNGGTGEDRLSILRKFDTVFLIDDSPSMAGPKWEMVQTILDYCTPVAARYDTDGIDIHFFNNTHLNQEKVKSPEIAVQIHHDVSLDGSTPLLDQVSVHLKQYFQGYRKSGFAANYKRYNLIILTDGEPDDEYDEDGDPKDPVKPAFRLIRKKIVDYARKLDDDDVEAEPNQVGIQFCQIGDDQDAEAFFQYLDDRLKGKEKLGRDMVDTIRCETDLDLTEDFFRKLLLGAIDKKEDNRKIEEHPPANPQSPSNAQHTTLPDRSASIRTTNSRAWSETDNVASPTRQFSFPVVDRSLSTLQEVPTAESFGGQPPVLQKRQSTFKSRPSQSPEETSPPRRFSSLKNLGHFRS